MESFGKHYNAAGKNPEFGAIFMSSSATKRECLERRLFGLPSCFSQFVKQVKAGMILFLFEYEKRELHGVYRSCCDGAMNIVPDAFSSSGKQFSAQVKFTPIWYCEPLKESFFRDAIKENYFSSKKFYFGLSEKQVHTLLNLFRRSKLKPELPGKLWNGMEDVKPECYPLGKVGRSVDGRMHGKIVKHDQDAVANTMPFTMHNHIHRVDAEIELDSASGYFGDYLALEDHCTFTGHNKEHSINMPLRPSISCGLSGKLPEVGVHEDDRLRVSDRLMSEDHAKHGQRMVFLDDSPGLHSSNVNLSFFSGKPMLDPDFLVQNQLRATSAMPVSDNFCAAGGDLSSKSIHLYDPDAPGFGSRLPSSVRITDSSKSMLGSASPSNNYRRNIDYSLNGRLSHMHTRLKDTNLFQDESYGLGNHVPYESNRTSMPLYAVQNSEQLAAKTVEDEGHSFHLKSSSVPLSPLDIGNRCWGFEPYSSLYNKYNSGVSNDISLQENLHHEMTLQKNNKTCSPVVPRENQGHSLFQYGNPLIHEHGPGYKNKNSVFSRLSFVQGFNNRESGSNNHHGEYDVCTYNSVDEVMEMVRQSCNQWEMKRKVNPLVKHGKARSLKCKKQISSSRLIIPSFEQSLDEISTDMTTASEGKTNQIGQGIQFVDFKRRSHVRKINEESEIRDSDESVRSEDKGTVQQKRRKLIRPNFSNNTTFDKKDINLSASQNLQVSLPQESSEPKDDHRNCNALVQSGQNIKIDGEELDLVCQTQSQDTSNNAKGCVNSEGGEQLRDGQFMSNIGLNDGSECTEHLNNQNASSSAYFKSDSFHNKEGLCMKDDTKPISSDTELQHSICQAQNKDKVLGGSTGIKTGGVQKDGKEPITIEAKDRSQSLQIHAIPGINTGGVQKDGTEPITIEAKDRSQSLQILASTGINTGGVQKDGKELTIEAKDRSQSLHILTNENLQSATCLKSNCNIKKGSNMLPDLPDSKYTSVPESSETFEESSEKEKGISFHH